MPTLFLQAELAWSQIIQLGPTVVILALILIFLIRVAPTWKEIRLKELELRGEENVVKREQAGALTQLAGALKEIAVEQRRATEEVNILQRVNSDSNDRLSHHVHTLTERLERLEDVQSSSVRQTVSELASRVEAVEKNVQTQSTAA